MSFPSQIVTLQKIYGYNPNGIDITTIYAGGEHFDISSTKSGFLTLIPEMNNPALHCYDNASQIPSGEFTVVNISPASAGEVYVNPSTGEFRFNEFETVNDVYFFYTGYGSLVSADSYYNPMASGLVQVQQYALALASGVQTSSGNLAAHILNTNNPHNTTYVQVGAAAANHTHDDRYYTETEINDLLDSITASGDYVSNSVFIAASGYLQSSINTKENTITSGTTSQFWRGDKTWVSITPATIGAQPSGDYATANQLILTSGVLQAAINDKANLSHNHNSTYYTEAEIDNFLDQYVTITSLGLILTDINNSISQKEPAIPSGINNTYWRGDKTWASITPTTIGAQPSGDYAINSFVIAISGDLQDEINSKSSIGHTHDDRYYTEVEISDILTGYQPSGNYVTNNELLSTSGNLQTSINNKENLIASSTTAKYFRGDKSWQDLSTSAVLEDTNLYYTNDRVDTRITLQKGANNGIATLNESGKIPTTQLPALVITDTFVVSNEASMLALNAQQGDIAVRTDLNQSFILTNDTPASLSNWQRLLTPDDAVISVNGQTGVVTLTTSNISEGSNLYYTDSRARSAISVAGSTPLTYNNGTIGILQASASGYGWLSSTDWNAFNSKQNSSPELSGLSNLTPSGIGFLVRTNASGIYATRNILSGDNIFLSNSNGLFGDVTISLDPNPNIGALVADSVWSGNLISANGGIQLNTGSLSLPSIHFNDDTDTGIYSSASDSLDIVSSGVALISIKDPNTNNGRIHFPYVGKNTIAKFGSSTGIYIIDPYPHFGFNIYGNPGYTWGTSNGYGAIFHFDPSDGSITEAFTNETSTGANTSANLTARSRLARSRLGVVISGGDGTANGVSNRYPDPGCALSVERGHFQLRTPVSHGDAERSIIWQNFNQNSWHLQTEVGTDNLRLIFNPASTNIKVLDINKNTVTFTSDYDNTLSTTYSFRVKANDPSYNSLQPSNVSIEANHAKTSDVYLDNYLTVVQGGHLYLKAGSVINGGGGANYESGTYGGNVYIDAGQDDADGNHGAIYFRKSNNLGGATNYGYVDYTGIVSSNNLVGASGVYGSRIFASASGNPLTPTYSHNADTDTGIYFPDVNTCGITTSGVLRFSANTSNLISTLPLLMPSGTAAQPSYSFSTDTDTGIYSTGVNSLGFATNGTNMLTINNLSSNFMIYASGATSQTSGNPILLRGEISQANYAGPIAISASTIYTNTALTIPGTTVSIYGANIGASAAVSTNATAGGIGRAVYGARFTATNTGTDIGTSSTRITYGVSTLATGDTNASSTAFGAHLTATGADSNFGAYADGATSCFTAGRGGTAAAPAFSFYSDQDTGFYSDSSNTFKITTGGTLRVTIDSSGIMATGYKSSDGSAGINTTFNTSDGHIITVKNGLITSKVLDIGG